MMPQSACAHCGSNNKFRDLKNSWLSKSIDINVDLNQTMDQNVTFQKISTHFLEEEMVEEEALVFFMM